MSDDEMDFLYLPIGDTDLIEAVIAVRGKDYPLQLLRSHFDLRPSAHLVNGEEGYLLIIDENDRNENPKLGLVEAVEVTSTESCRRLMLEVSSWELADYQSIESELGATAIVKLGLISLDNLNDCSGAIRDAYMRRDLGL